MQTLSMEQMINKENKGIKFDNFIENIIRLNRSKVRTDKRKNKIKKLLTYLNND